MINYQGGIIKRLSNLCIFRCCPALPWTYSPPRGSLTTLLIVWPPRGRTWDCKGEAWTDHVKSLGSYQKQVKISHKFMEDSVLYAEVLRYWNKDYSPIVTHTYCWSERYQQIQVFLTWPRSAINHWSDRPEAWSLCISRWVHTSKQKVQTCFFDEHHNFNKCVTKLGASTNGNRTTKHSGFNCSAPQFSHAKGIWWKDPCKHRMASIMYVHVYVYVKLSRIHKAKLNWLLLSRHQQLPKG